MTTTFGVNGATPVSLGKQYYTPLGDQLAILGQFYPWLDGSMTLGAAAAIPEKSNAEARILVPKDSAVARHAVYLDTGRTPGYAEVLGNHPLSYLSKQRAFWHMPVLGSDNQGAPIRPSAPWIKRVAKLEQETPGDYLILDVQTGDKWRERSPLIARQSFHDSRQHVPFTTWMAAHLLLTNPQRLEHRNQLGIDCPGDEVRPEGHNGFPYVPCFRMTITGLRLGSRAKEHASKGYGAASVLLD